MPLHAIAFNIEHACSGLLKVLRSRSMIDDKSLRMQGSRWHYGKGKLRRATLYIHPVEMLSNSMKHKAAEKFKSTILHHTAAILVEANKLLFKFFIVTTAHGLHKLWTKQRPPPTHTQRDSTYWSRSSARKCLVFITVTKEMIASNEYGPITLYITHCFMA